MSIYKNIEFIEEIIVKSRERFIIYLLIDKEEVVYVGQSSCGLRRPFLHQFGNKIDTEKIFTSIKVFKAPEKKDDRCRIERSLIYHFNPKYNRR